MHSDIFCCRQPCIIPVFNFKRNPNIQFLSPLIIYEGSAAEERPMETINQSQLNK